MRYRNFPACYPTRHTVWSPAVIGPERAAVETLSGTVRNGPVIDCETRVEDRRPVQYLTVEIENGHNLEVPESEATLP